MTTGTIGYRIADVKRVDLRGEKPAFYKMMMRVLISVVGPFQLPYDLVLIREDMFRQSLRDKYAGTFVIRRKAKAIDQRPLTGNYYFVHGFALLFREPAIFLPE